MKGLALKLRGMLAVFTASALAVSLVPAGALAFAASESDTESAPPETTDTVDPEIDPSDDRWWSEYFDVVDEAEDILLGHDWHAAPGAVTDGMTFWAWLEAQVYDLGLIKVNIRIDQASLRWEAPVAGTPENPAGTPGTFSVNIYVYRSWLNILPARRVQVSGVMDAVPYLAPDDPTPDQPSDPGPAPEPEPEPGTDPEPEPEPEPAPGPEPEPEPGIDPDVPAPGPGPGQKPVIPGHPGLPDKPNGGDDAPVLDDDPTQDARVQETIDTVQEALKALPTDDASGAVQLDVDGSTLSTALSNVVADGALTVDPEEAKALLKTNVKQMVQTKLESIFAEKDFPEGTTFQVQDPEIVLPTADEEGSYSCAVNIYLDEEAAEQAEPEPVAVIEAQGLALHPLSDAEAATDVRAQIGDNSNLPDGSVVKRPVHQFAVTGAIPKLREVQKPSHVNDGLAAVANPQHPLANAQTPGITPDGSGSSSQSDTSDDREIKRPQQQSSDKRNTPSVTTTVKKGSTIAITNDPLSGGMTLLASIGSMAAVVAAVGLILTRRKREK